MKVSLYNSDDMAKNMAKIILLVCTAILAKGKPVSAEINCDPDPRYFTPGNRAEVKCDFDGLFNSVKWYKDSSTPFLRLEAGIEIVVEGYDVTDEGAMVIQNIQSKHQRTYTVEVEYIDDTKESATIDVKLIVSLADNPTIINCSLSLHELCRDVDENSQLVTLLCLTGSTLPQVTLTWESLSLHYITYNASFDMYGSYSLLQYNPYEFALDYLTCKASGKAVLAYTNTSIYVEGLRSLPTNTNIDYATYGSKLEIECSKNRYIISRWEVEYPNGMTQLLRKTFPGNESGSCIVGNRCHVNDGTLTIDDVTIADKGIYECVYNDGTINGRYAIDFDVIVPPTPPQTIIEGCEDDMDCHLDVVNTGKLKCSIIGSIPAVESMFVSLESDNTSLILKYYSQEVFENAGTYNTSVYFTYDIPECSGPVNLECSTQESFDFVASSKVTLVTATKSCSTKTKIGVIIFVVILFFTLLAVGLWVFFKRDLGICSDYSVLRGKRERNDPEEMQSKGISVSEDGMPTPEVDTTEITNEETPLADSESQEKGMELTLQEKFDMAFQPMYDGIVDKESTDDGFINMITSFCSQNQADNPTPFLLDFLQRQTYNDDEEELMTVLIFIVDIQGSKSNVQFTDVPEKLRETEKLSAYNYTMLAGHMYRNHQIDMKTYVEKTGPLLNRQLIPFQLVLNEFTEFIKTRYCSREDSASAVVDYYLGNYITGHVILESICDGETTYSVLYPYILQSIQEKFRKDETLVTREYLLKLFNKLRERYLDTKHGSYTSLSDDVDQNGAETNVRNAFIRALFLCIESNIVGSDTFTEMIEKSEVTNTEFQELVPPYIENGWMSGETLIKILTVTLDKKLISDEFYSGSLQTLVIKDKLSFDDYIISMKTALVKKMMSERCFEIQITHHIYKEMLDKEDFIKLITELASGHEIDDGMRLRLFQCVIKKHSMSEAKVKKIIKETGLSDNEVKSVLANVKFPGLGTRVSKTIMKD